MRRHLTRGQSLFSKLSASAVVLVAFLLGGCQADGDRVVSEQSLALGGVVIERVAEGSVLQKAGLQARDILRSWERPERLPNPPANPATSRGTIGSVFDWLWMKVEQAPRGPMKLTGEREGEARVFHVAMGEWNATVRPRLSASIQTDYLEGQERTAANKFDEAIALWREMEEGLKETVDWRMRCGLSLRMGEIWAEAREWEKALTLYRSALGAIRNPTTKAAFWTVIGSIYERKDVFEEAVAAYRLALKIQESQAPDSLAVAASLNNLGGHSLECGVTWTRLQNFFIELWQFATDQSPTASTWQRACTIWELSP